MKTALQNLIETIDYMIKSGDDNLLPLRIYAVKFLEIEKEQITLSYEQGYQDGRDEHYMSAEFDSAEHYFKETQKQ